MTKMNWNRPIHQKPKYKRIDEGNEPVLKNIYLVCPYRDKDKVKELGAQWHPEHKLWYIKSNNPNLSKIIPWLHPDDRKEYFTEEIEPVKEIEKDIIRPQGNLDSKLARMLRELNSK